MTYDAPCAARPGVRGEHVQQAVVAKAGKPLDRSGGHSAEDRTVRAHQNERPCTQSDPLLGPESLDVRTAGVDTRPDGAEIPVLHLGADSAGVPAVFCELRTPDQGDGSDGHRPTVSGTSPPRGPIPALVWMASRCITPGRNVGFSGSGAVFVQWGGQ